jgi:branched-chain amino acid aminotransferase
MIVMICYDFFARFAPRGIFFNLILNLNLSLNLSLNLIPNLIPNLILSLNLNLQHYLAPMNRFINHNGHLVPEDEPVLTPASRAFRYGDGLFETMRMENGRIALEQYHFERLFSGLQTLQFTPPKHFTAQYLLHETEKLCHKNNCTASARIRLTCFRASGGLFDPQHHQPQFTIEAWPLSLPLQLNENGLVTGLYPDVQKSCDALAGLKTNNALPYAMAALHAKNQRWNDAFLLNSNGRIADSSIANIFLVNDKSLSTPPLSEACIAGTMRRHLLAALPALGYTITETPLTIPMLHQAGEVFLTNAIHGIRWVQSFEDTHYSNIITARIYHDLIPKLWGGSAIPAG